MGSMDDILRRSLLFDFYGELLTDHQKEIYEAFDSDDLSLSEIAGLSPWILDGATPDEVRTLITELPPPVRILHRYWWNPRYRRTRRWQ